MGLSNPTTKPVEPFPTVTFKPWIQFLAVAAALTFLNIIIDDRREPAAPGEGGVRSRIRP